MHIKLKPTLFIIAFIFFINAAFSQEKKKTAIIINTGYPVITGIHITHLEKKRNLFFLEFGVERYMSDKVFYSFGLSAYNLYYKTSYKKAVLGGLLGKYLLSKIEPRVCIWREFILKNNNIIDFGFGLTGYFETNIWLEDKSNRHKRTWVDFGLVGLNTACKYYFKLKEKNSLGILVESNYFFLINNVDFGIGLAYRHTF